MPKRSQGKQVSDGEAKTEGSAEAPRATKSNAVLREEERIENARALDVAAGVASVKTVQRDEVTRPANATAHVKADTREKRLYEIARACTGNLNDAFFDEFPDRQEILDLALDISTRLLTVAILNGDVPPTQRISAMRLVAALNGRQLPPAEDGEPTKVWTAPPLTIPTGATDDVQRSLDKIRELSKSA